MKQNGQRDSGGRGKIESRRATQLKDIGITRDQSSKWQQLAEEIWGGAADLRESSVIESQNLPARLSPQNGILKSPILKGDAVSYAPYSIRQGGRMRCKERDALFEAWREAIAALGDSVSLWSSSDGDYEARRRQCEDARLHAENVQTLLTLHRSEHGC